MMPSDHIAVDVQQLLAFFDEEAPGSAGHATSLVAVAGEDLGAALLLHYLQSVGTDAEVLPERCTQGTKKGPRLDRWVLARSMTGRVLYQVEIKNWSAHAIGGKTLSKDASADALRAYKIERWSSYWTGAQFRNESVRKVLIPMRSPRPQIPVEPLVCFWTALHPDGHEAPLFSVPLPSDEHLSRVWVFSMSSYLRSIREPTLVLRMPEVAQRYTWLTRLFRITG